MPTETLCLLVTMTFTDPPLDELADEERGYRPDPPCEMKKIKKLRMRNQMLRELRGGNSSKSNNSYQSYESSIHFASSVFWKKSVDSRSANENNEGLGSSLSVPKKSINPTTKTSRSNIKLDIFSLYACLSAIAFCAAIFYMASIEKTGYSRTEEVCAFKTIENPNLSLLFRGDASRYTLDCFDMGQEPGPNYGYFPRISTVIIVVAYCNADISWFNKAIEEDIPDGMAVQMVFLSKCGNEENIASLKPSASSRVERIDIIPLANVEGCDYAYIYYMNNILLSNPSIKAMTSSSIVLFVKDTIRDRKHFHFKNHGGYRSIGEMIKIASRGEFACGIYPQRTFSWYHDTKSLTMYSMDSYTRISQRKGSGSQKIDDFNAFSYRNLGDFHDRALFGYKFPQQFTPVCYGGSFAIALHKMVEFFSRGVPSGKDVLQYMESSMMRKSESMIEEHFVERTWAGLFSELLTKNQITQLEKSTINIDMRPRSICGQIELDIACLHYHADNQYGSAFPAQS